MTASREPLAEPALQPRPPKAVPPQALSQVAAAVAKTVEEAAAAKR